MTVSMEDVKAALAADEVDYPAAARLGAEALPLLAELVRSDDPMLASKATYLASMIPGPGQVEIVTEACSSPEPTVRIAAAVGINGLGADAAENLVAGLLEDPDIGVRKQAIMSATRFVNSPRIANRLRGIEGKGPSDALSDHARRSLGG